MLYCNAAYIVELLNIYTVNIFLYLLYMFIYNRLFQMNLIYNIHKYHKYAIFLYGLTKYF